MSLYKRHQTKGFSWYFIKQFEGKRDFLETGHPKNSAKNNGDAFIHTTSHNDLYSNIGNDSIFLCFDNFTRKHLLN